MFILKPEDVVSFYTNEDARVKDEVLRISSLLTERLPGSRRPRHINGSGNFVLKIAGSADQEFMQKVAAAFEAMNVGWQAKLVRSHDICGPSVSFVLTHDSFAALRLPNHEDRDIPD